MPNRSNPEAPGPALPRAENERAIWLRVGTLIDGVSDRPARRAQVVYNRHGILWVGNDRALPPAAIINHGRTQPHLDLPDYTLLPGLIEAHAHFFLEGGELDGAKRSAWLRRSGDELLGAGAQGGWALVRLGVIAVRDAGDKDGVGLALSKLYQSPDRLLMPYVDSPGPAIHRKGRYGGFMGEPMEAHSTLNECVKARVAAGADRIKLIPTGNY